MLAFGAPFCRPGDMGVSSAVAFATTGDIESAKQSLNTLYNHQNPTTGMMPYVGPEVFCLQPEGTSCGGRAGSWNSDTYHLWALAGTANVYTYSAPAEGREWLRTVWKGVKRAVAASLAKVGSNGLMVVTARADWQRSGQGGENVAANAVLCHVVRAAATMAAAMNDTAAAASYGAAAASLATAINSPLLWDEVRVHTWLACTKSS
jgi:hypothetical protein